MKKHLSIGTLALLLGLGSGGAVALSDADVEKRLDRLEKKVKNVDKRSEKRFNKTNSQIDKYLNRLKINGFLSAGVSTSDEDNPLTSHGLVTDSENYVNNAVAGLQFDFTINDKASAVLQLTANGRGHKGAGDNSANLMAEWAYLGYDITEDFSVRAGRLRLPFYMASEYLEVGYAYPWVSPPGVVYGVLPFDSYYGADFTWDFSVGDVDIAWQAYRGTVDLELDLGQFNIDQMYGSALTFNMGAFLFRTSYTQTSVKGNFSTDGIAPEFVLESADYQAFASTIGPAMIAGGAMAACTAAALGGPCDADVGFLATAGATDDDMYLLYMSYVAGGSSANPADILAGAADVEENFAQVESFRASFLNYALAYNDYGWNVVLEGDKFEADGNIQNTEAYYLSVAKQLGAWTPYVVYGEIESTTNSDFGDAVADVAPVIVNGIGFHPVSHAETTVGVRWDFTSGMALKLETNRLSGFDDTRGLFLNPLDADTDNVNVYTMSLDAVF